MPNLLRWIFDQGKNIYRRFRGDKLERSISKAAVDGLTDRYIVQSGSRDVAGLLQQLVDGQPLSSWVTDYRQTLKESYIAAYLSARGGRGAMTASDWGQLGAMLKAQYRYLNGLAEDIASGKLLVDGRLQVGRIRARMEMYFRGANMAYERGKSNSLGMPRLPAYPGDGTTQCLTNCACHWHIEETDDEWLATWTLGAAEHCPDCVRRSGEWNPYRMSKERVE